VIFAVEDKAAQFLSGEVVDGLTPDTTYTISGSTFRTLPSPPGELLCRFATVSDLHVGERGFGLWPRFREDPRVPVASAYPARCGRAALAEAAAWGASLVVAKGDLTWSGRALQWSTVADVLATSPVPVHATFGNHDVVPKAVDGRAALAAAGVAVASHTEPAVVDLPGIRIVIANSAEDGHRRGSVGGPQQDAIVDAVASAGGPAFVAMHHYVDRLPFVYRYPNGIPKAEGEALLSAIARANPSTFVSAGHTHRNRRSSRFGLPVTEVGSTKDYPGVWAGYAVHEGGILQVVRRITDPSCIEWTDPTRNTLLGLWKWWSPGRLSWRCFTHRWP
jgi:predicted phosphodiesterase